MRETPYLTIDLARVRDNLQALRAALPEASIRYAVKANPGEPILRLLAGEGAAFDVASVGEIHACRSAGIDGSLLAFGNTIKKPAAVGHAYAGGVRRFVFDTPEDLAAIAEHAPGASVECRIAPAFPSSVTPFGHKFGCAPDGAANLLTRARRLGLRPAAIAFHVGSQQLDPAAWDLGIRCCADIFEQYGGALEVNAGGGFPIPYATDAPKLPVLADTITSALTRYFGADRPRLVVEPGRLLVGSAGIIAAEVVSVRTGTEGRRWVYLDIGRYGGLAETENEYLRYRLRTDRDGDPAADAVVAGPTCDGDDVLYRSYALPVTLRAGDGVQIENAGAYTASYASAGFNGFSPLPTYFTNDTGPGIARTIIEELAPGLSRHWQVDDVICDVRTEFQELVIGRTAQGVTLFSGGERQSTEFSQLVYHEALLVPALLLAERIDRVLVIGSGEGVVSQLAVAAGASHVDHVDIDRDAVRLCAEHLPYGYAVSELHQAERGLGPVTVHYRDGWEFVQQSTECYDVVVFDLPDERTGPAQHNRLYDVDFLRRCRAIGHVVVSQAGCPTLWRNASLRRSWRRFHETFDTVVYFGSDEHEWAFLSGLCGPIPEDPIAAMTARLPGLAYRPRTIDADSLAGCTVAPKSLRG
ncbi:pyridoxal-dependent decarboxylase, pyridoxal binding domain protein [Mycobacterium kansasii 732]|uniref:spermine/spermidine synthase domain-containing protein n=1 Tax=Mycobacterium pseudokansasii TaxID=2341080 RepID=UPI0004472ECC|nr:alanine racemase [Mycobacterium pseudokansasii]EUA08042.1 pyridoxal-dependent decarboxylase, pyridoxal binding domain protein [Mycobacterium kansasii 732]